MDIPNENPAPTVISSASARGASDPESGNPGDTLLPMLIGALVLIVIGVALVLLIV